MNASDGKTITLAVGNASVETYFYELGSTDGQPVVFMQTGGAGTSAYMCWYRNLEQIADAGLTMPGIIKPASVICSVFATWHH